MSFLFASSSAKAVPELTGLQIQTSVNVLPVPIIYGSPMVSFNVIYANGFRSKKVSSGGSSGGKGLFGGGGKGGSGGETDYFATFIGSIGEGNISALIEIYENRDIYTLATLPAGKTIIFFPGTDDQSPWDYVASRWPADSFSYMTTCYIGLEDYPLGTSNMLPNFSLVCHAVLAGTSPLNTYVSDDGHSFLLDADPALCIYDFLTNETYGVGFPAAYIDSTTLNTTADGYVSGVGDSTLSSYCQAIGLAWSLALNNAEPASTILDRLLKNLVVAAVWTGAILKFIPYRDTYCSDNPGLAVGETAKYYSTDPAPLFDLTDDDYIRASAANEDPLTGGRVDVAEIRNVVRISYRDRSNRFNSNVSEAKDETSVELYGPRVSNVGEAQEFIYDDYAATSVRTQLQRNLSVRRTYTFKVSWAWCVLDPMDIITITDKTLGLSKFAVRVTSIEEDEKGFLTLMVEEFPALSATATRYPRPTNTPPIIKTNVVPHKVNTPFIFEPTKAMLDARGQTGPRVVLGASGGPSGTFDPNWGGCDVYLSDDGVTYVKQGSLTGPSRQGTTTATLAAYGGANPDNAHTLSVTLAECDGTLASVTAAQAAAGLSVCAIQDAGGGGGLELVGYTTATLTAANTYNLTGLYRGLYGTQPCAHASGSLFLRVDNSVFSAELLPEFIGVSLYVKLPSFNIFGSAPESLADCVVYRYSPTGTSTDVKANPVIAALLAGTGVDLGNASGAGVDLNLGGAEGCAPILVMIDLNA